MIPCTSIFPTGMASRWVLMFMAWVWVMEGMSYSFLHTSGMFLLNFIFLINNNGIFSHKTQNLKPPSSWARNFLKFISSYVRRKFNLNVERHEIYFKPDTSHIKERATTLGGVSNLGNFCNDYFMTSFVKLVKRAQN